MDILSYVLSKMKAEALKTPFSNQTASFYIFIKSEQLHKDPQPMAKLRE